MIFASDSNLNLRSLSFRSLIFRIAVISQSIDLKRKISNREFISKADELSKLRFCYFLQSTGESKLEDQKKYTLLRKSKSPAATR